MFVVADAKTRIAATTPPEPTVGLVFYDLKSALRSIATKPKAPRKRTSPRKKPDEAKPPAARKKPAPRKKKTDAS